MYKKKDGLCQQQGHVLPPEACNRNMSFRNSHLQLLEFVQLYAAVGVNSQLLCTLLSSKLVPVELSESRILEENVLL
jgi:hypothetical protein